MKVKLLVIAATLGLGFVGQTLLAEEVASTECPGVADSQRDPAATAAAPSAPPSTRPQGGGDAATADGQTSE